MTFIFQHFLRKLSFAGLTPNFHDLDSGVFGNPTYLRQLGSTQAEIGGSVAPFGATTEKAGKSSKVNPM